MADYADRTVLLTGGQGFVGSWLAERLLAEGARVVVPRRDVHPDSRFVQEGIEGRCHTVQADLDDYDALLRVINEHEVAAVFHLAAQTIVGTANRSPLSTFEANVRGTYNLLEACRSAEVVGTRVERIVVASSDKAYGAHEQLPYTEDAPLIPVFPYDVSKACTDLIARSYAHAFELPVAVTRLANVYGGGDVNWSRLVPETARALARGERPLIRSDGSPERDYLYAADAVEAYLAIAASLDSEELRGRAWNAGAGRPVSVRELVEKLTEISGRDIKPEIEGSGVPPGEIDRQYLDSTAISTELGWSPRYDLEEGLRETWAWYERAFAD
jgi:CDP-glucose 4,6-dehydratase